MADNRFLDLDQAFAYATRLRAKPDTGNGTTRTIDWNQAPWQVKIYRAEPDRWISGSPDAARSGLLRWLTATAGVSRTVCTTSPEPASGTTQRSFAHRATTRRPVASGGAMYPTEIYAVLHDADGCATAYHFDPARHEMLELNRSAAPSSFPCRTVDSQHPACAVLLTHRFWKNFHKYGDFAYRLGAVDTGVLLGRLLRLFDSALGRVRVRFDFDDSAAHQLLGLDEREEAVYAVLDLHAPSAVAEAAPAAGLARPRSPKPTAVERSASVRFSPHLHAMQLASSSPHPASTPGAPVAPNSSRPAFPVRRLVSPAPIQVATSAPLARRRSNGPFFTGRAVPESALSTVLADCWARQQALMGACHDGGLPPVRIHCALLRVDGLAAGWYHYEPEGHALIPIGGAEDPGRELQTALHSPSMDAGAAAFVVHVSSHLDFRTSIRGARQYRVQQMLVGAAVDAVTVSAAVLALGAHPLLGFDAERIDRRYRLNGGFGTLAQICVGVARGGPSLEGRVW